MEKRRREICDECGCNPRHNGVVLRTLGRSTPTVHRFGSVVGRTFAQDVLDVHFDGVFRKVEPRGLSTCSQAELQRRQHLLLARRNGRPSSSRGSLAAAVAVTRPG